MYVNIETDHIVPTFQYRQGILKMHCTQGNEDYNYSFSSSHLPVTSLSSFSLFLFPSLFPLSLPFFYFPLLLHSSFSFTPPSFPSALTSLLGKRSLVISRSTYPGSGTHTGHWLGDNTSQWKHMLNSIAGIPYSHVTVMWSHVMSCEVMWQ